MCWRLRILPGRLSLQAYVFCFLQITVLNASNHEFITAGNLSLPERNCLKCKTINLKLVIPYQNFQFISNWKFQLEPIGIFTNWVLALINWNQLEIFPIGKPIGIFPTQTPIGNWFQLAKTIDILATEKPVGIFQLENQLKCFHLKNQLEFSNWKTNLHSFQFKLTKYQLEKILWNHG